MEAKTYVFSVCLVFSVAVYSEPKGNMLCMFQGQQGGITHIMFSPDGNKLYTGARKVTHLPFVLRLISAIITGVTEGVPW